MSVGFSVRRTLPAHLRDATPEELCAAMVREGGAEGAGEGRRAACPWSGCEGGSDGE